MKILTQGHKYELESFDGRVLQEIQFIEKEMDQDTNLLKTINDGTTNEEVLKVLIDRLQFLNAKVPSRESSIAITKIQEGLMWLEKRTEDRADRKVEGTRKM